MILLFVYFFINKINYLIMSCNDDRTKPHWRDETLVNGNRAISVRMYDVNKNKDKIKLYKNYLESVCIYLNGRINSISEISTLSNESLCCIIYLNDCKSIKIK